LPLLSAVSAVATTSAGLLLLLELDLARHPGEAADSAMLASRSSQLSNLMKSLSLTDPSLPTRCSRCWLLAALQVAGMSCSANGTQEIARNVKYSLGSPWYDVPTAPATFTVRDDLAGAEM
jgi:hypothetical protein